MAPKKISAETLTATRAKLLELLAPGDTVYTILRHVSSSGMSRRIGLVIPAPRERREEIPADATIRSFKGLSAYMLTGEDQYVTASVSGQRLAGDELLLQYPPADQGGPPTGPCKVWRRRCDLRVHRTTHVPAIRSIAGLAADLLGATWTDDDAIRVGGAGMDMGFHLVYSLGSALWPDGTKKPHGTRNGEPDRAGGYALKHQWL